MSKESEDHRLFNHSSNSPRVVLAINNEYIDQAVL